MDPKAGDVVAAMNADSRFPLALHLCQVPRPYKPQPAGEAAIARQAFCLAAIAALWSDYVRMQGNGYSGQGGLDAAFEAAATVYSYAVGELGSDAKGYFDAALTGAFGSPAPAASPDPSALKTIKQLLGAPHKRPRPSALATTYRDAIAATAGVLTRKQIPIGGVQYDEVFVPGVAGCAYQAKTGDATLRLGDQLGNCQTIALWMWKLSTSEPAALRPGRTKAAFEMGYANARTDCAAGLSQRVRGVSS